MSAPRLADAAEDVFDLSAAEKTGEEETEALDGFGVTAGTDYKKNGG